MNDATQQKIEECISILEDVETELTDEVNSSDSWKPNAISLGAVAAARAALETA